MRRPKHRKLFLLVGVASVVSGCGAASKDEVSEGADSAGADKSAGAQQQSSAGRAGDDGAANSEAEPESVVPAVSEPAVSEPVPFIGEPATPDYVDRQPVDGGLGDAGRVRVQR